MRRGRTKKRDQHRHFKQRVRLRTGLDLSNNDVHEIALMIQRQKGKYVESQSNRVSVWLIEFKGQEFNIVYDKERKQPITCLIPS